MATLAEVSSALGQLRLRENASIFVRPPLLAAHEASLISSSLHTPLPHRLNKANCIM